VESRSHFQIMGLWIKEPSIADPERMRPLIRRLAADGYDAIRIFPRHTVLFHTDPRVVEAVGAMVAMAHEAGIKAGLDCEPHAHQAGHDMGIRHPRGMGTRIVPARTVLADGRYTLRVSWPRSCQQIPYLARVDAFALKDGKARRVDVSGAQRIAFRCRVTNISGEPRLLDYWLQSIARIGGIGEENHYFRPNSKGFSVTSTIDPQGNRSFVHDIGGGWCAVVNRARRISAFYTFDPDAMDRLYNSEPSVTQEFMYQTIPLPPGGAWETRLTLRVVEGIATPVFANAALVAGAEVELAADRYTIRHQVAAMDKPLRNWRLSTAVTDLLTKQTVQGATAAGDEIGDAVTEIAVEMTLPTSGARLVVVTLEHADGVETYEFPIAAFGDFSTSYTRNVTRRPPVFPKPDENFGVCPLNFVP